MPNTVLGKVTCTPKGEYVGGTSYEILDIVGYGGGSYMAIKNDPEGAPSNDGVNWMQLAAQGGKGNTGAAAGFGEPTATVDQTTGTPSVSVEATGPNTAKVFSFAFSGIKGERGIQGIQGETGETGEAAGFGEPTATVDNNVGTPGVTVTATGPDTAKVFSFSFVNLKGDQGEQGIQGVQGEQGEPGTSVASIQRTSGTGAPGTTDVYTMYDSEGGTIGTFTVYNGSNGSGSGDLMSDGSVPMTGALNMGGNKVTNLGAPGADADAVRKQDLDAVAAEVDGILDGTTPAHLAPATETKIGGVIIGEGLSVTEDGTVSADDQIPTNGTAGQILTQTSTGPSWQDAPSGLPDGGTEGQILTKGANGPEWADAPDPLPAGGTTGQLLTKTADGVAWENPPDTGVISFNGRKGEVSPGADDYSASMIKFTDGQTFQQKCDAGQLTGPAGTNGTDGKDATINGVNALTLEVVEGAGIVGTQTGTTFKIDATELFQSVSNGKSLIAGAITDKGVSTSADATFQQMADNIIALPAGGADYYTGEVTAGYSGKFYDYSFSLPIDSSKNVLIFLRDTASTALQSLVGAISFSNGDAYSTVSLGALNVNISRTSESATFSGIADSSGPYPYYCVAFTD